MRKLIIILILIYYCPNSFAQSFKKTFNDCASIKNYKVYINDTVVIQCDSLILMNQFTFDKYSTAYDRLRNNNSTTLEVFHRYDTLIAYQQQRILEQNSEYGQLKFEYDSLNSNTNTIILKTQNDLRYTRATLDSTALNLQETKVMLNEAQEKIKNEKYQRLKSKFSWGAGGLTILWCYGFILSALPLELV